MIEQKNKGSGNTNNNNSNNQIMCIINVNGKDEEVELLDILNAISLNFESEDERINEKLSNKVLINKTNDHETYQTYKIITSLLQLGIPLTAAYSIAQLTINHIKEFIYENGGSSVELSTKDIRKMVSQSIQEIDVQHFSYEDIESWNNQYIRRYGHNNKRIRIYYSNSDQTDEISYEYINTKLAVDIVRDITKDRIKYSEIPSKYQAHIAHEILSFINSCDLYKINYKILKEIIKEIALQPPHPWFISDKTRSDIIKYDIDCLKSNINKIKEALENDVDSSQYVKIEILHHASALILEKYNYFLGCYDLSAFYLLKELLNELIDVKKWDLTVHFSQTSEILEDLAFSHINILSLCNTIDRINGFLKNQNIINQEFDNLILNLAENALKLNELGNKNSIKDFLQSEWNTFPFEEVIKNLKLLLYSIYPVKSWNLDTNKTYFWLNYKSVNSSVDVKNQIFTIYNDGSLNDYSFLSILTTPNAKALCDTIFVISQTKAQANFTCKTVNEYLKNINISNHYKVIWIDKNIAYKIFTSTNKMKCLDDTLLKQLEIELMV